MWKNFFNLSTPSMKILKQVKQRLVQNVQHVRYDWGGNQGKDFFILAMLATCTKLESLEIVVDVRCVNRPTQGWNSHKPQRLHQDDSRIQKFSRTNGFDKLISLGELKKVIVTKNWTLDHAIKHGQVTEAEFKAFGDFVKEKLTRKVKPILAMPPVVRPPVARPFSDEFYLNRFLTTFQGSRPTNLHSNETVKQNPDAPAH